VQNDAQQMQADGLAQISAAADAQRQTVPMGDGSATLVWSEELGSSALIMDGVPALPGHQVYELWYIDASGARSAGTFTAGNGQVARVLEGTMRPGDTVGVTVEPRGGSPIPTTDPIFVVETA